MIIRKMTIQEGVQIKTFEFSPSKNIIYSALNSVGKTTLLRLLIYSLGYAIPSTKKMNFSRCITTTLISNSIGEYTIIRQGDIVTVCDKSDKYQMFSLPIDFTALQRIIWNIGNLQVLNNLLGTYYVDQEKGWTLLNRGKVIGNIQFNIEELVRGLGGRDCDDLIERETALKRELVKYKYMLNTAEYQKQLQELNEDVAFDTPDEARNTEIDILRFQRKPLEQELQRIENVWKQNTSFKKFITNMRLVVLDGQGNEIPVNEDSLVGFKDNMEYLAAKRKITAAQIEQIDRKIMGLEGQVDEAETLVKVEMLIQSFDRKISKLKIDARQVDKIIKKIEEERKELSEKIIQSTKQNNDVVEILYRVISQYAKEVGLFGDYVKEYQDYIFTSDLKSLSGAIFYKIVYIFKLAYIKAVKEKTGQLLPIILDSPSGREVERATVEEMLAIVKRDFDEHQLIIASIFSYDSIDATVIELFDSLMENAQLIEIQ